MINDDVLKASYGVFTIGKDEKSDYQMAMSFRMKEINGRHLRVICQFVDQLASKPIERLSFWLEDVQQPLTEETVQAILNPFSEGLSWDRIGGHPAGGYILQRSDNALVTRVDGISVSFMSREAFLSKLNLNQ